MLKELALELLDLDIREKFIYIRDKYPTMVNGVRIHEWPDVNTIFAPNNAEKTKFVFEKKTMNTINDDGIALLTSCDGMLTTEELIEKFLTNVTENHEVVINRLIRFLLISHEYLNHITFNEVKHDKPILCEFTGTKEFITPLHFAIEITTKCNLRCKHCYRSSSPDIKDEELSYEEIILVLQKMYDIGARHIEVTGGEMFLHPRIKDILKFIGDNFEFIGLLTNGSALTCEMIDFLSEYKEKLIWSVSLDSYDELTHDKFRGLNGAFKRTVNAIKYLTTNGHAVRVAMSVTDKNIDHVEKTLEFARNDLKADWFGYNYVLPYGRGKELTWDIDQEKLANRVNEIDKYSDKYPGFTNKFTEQQVDEMKKKQKNCGAGWRTFTISPKGIIRPCVLMEESYITLGDILHKPLEEIMKQTMVANLNNLPWPLENTCKDCSNESFCKFCAYRGLLTNQERIKQGLGLCKWAKENNVDKFINIETAEIENGMCMYKNCSIND